MSKPAERYVQLLDQIIRPFDLTHDFGRKRAYEAAIEYARLGIRVNCLCPGWTNTTLTDCIRLAYGIGLKSRGSALWMSLGCRRSLSTQSDRFETGWFRVSDWNWFFSSLAQSVAALVGVLAAFMIARLLGGSRACP